MKGLRFSCETTFAIDRNMVVNFIQSRTSRTSSKTSILHISRKLASSKDSGAVDGLILEELSANNLQLVGRFPVDVS